MSKELQKLIHHIDKRIKDGDYDFVHYNKTYGIKSRQVAAVLDLLIEEGVVQVAIESPKKEDPYEEVTKKIAKMEELFFNDNSGYPNVLVVSLDVKQVLDDTIKECGRKGVVVGKGPIIYKYLTSHSEMEIFVHPDYSKSWYIELRQSDREKSIMGVVK